jgi:hypothetical protein
VGFLRWGEGKLLYRKSVMEPTQLEVKKGEEYHVAPAQQM